MLAGEPITLEDQIAQWEERKTAEKSARMSCMEDIPTGQPALALAQKVIARVVGAGLPADLIPSELTTVVVAVHNDAESDLRTAVLEFMDTVRRAESAIAASRRGTDLPAELDVAAPLGAVSEEEWRRHWPIPGGREPLDDIPAVPVVVSDDEPLDLGERVDDIELDVGIDEPGADN